MVDALLRDTEVLLCEKQEANEEFNLLKILGIAHKTNY